MLGTPGDTRRFRVLVSGPLPGKPSQSGEFVMLVKRFGDRPGWLDFPGFRDMTLPQRVNQCKTGISIDSELLRSWLWTCAGSGCSLMLGT